MNVGCECLVKVWGSGERLVRGDLVTGPLGAGAGGGTKHLVSCVYLSKDTNKVTGCMH